MNLTVELNLKMVSLNNESLAAAAAVEEMQLSVTQNVPIESDVKLKDAAAAAAVGESKMNDTSAAAVTDAAAAAAVGALGNEMIVASTAVDDDEVITVDLMLQDKLLKMTLDDDNCLKQAKWLTRHLK